MRATVLSCAALLGACGNSSGGHDQIDAPVARVDAPAIDAPAPSTPRDRLLATYLDWLQHHPGATTNGLDGAHLTTVCTLWSQLQPSAQVVFLTLTARMAGSHLVRDDSSILDHVTKLYWLTGGSNATATDPGSCGGEGNRMIMSIDADLHDVLHQVNAQTGGPAAARLIPDVIAASFWRNSHDLGGPHAPFDESDETEAGAPRGQVQFFSSTTSGAAMSPLGRPDLSTLVDPLAFEMDQDYDCTHNSNPLCAYTTYGALCALKPEMTGVAIYALTYGAVDLAWKPAGC